MRFFSLMLALGAGFLVRPTTAAAHEIPARVSIRAIVKPAGRTMVMLVRVPLEAMRDVDFPLGKDGYLDFSRSDSLMYEAAQIWVADAVKMFENGEPLRAGRVTHVRASLPSDRSFTSYSAALAHVFSVPLDNSIQLPWQQAMLDVALEFPIGSDSSTFAIETIWANLGVRTNTVLLFEPAGEAERVFSFDGNPGRFSLDPGFLNAAGRFVKLGFEHIFSGIDHILFLLCLILPFRRFRPLVAIVSSFTIAHSITLFASALGFAPAALWFPPLVEALIALSIVYMACENMIGARLDRRWVMAFSFGLVHGFGFSFGLRESMQFAGTHLITSLAAFNLGVEFGQLVLLAAALPLLIWLFRHVPERAGVIVASAFVAHTAWHWTTERVDQLVQYRFQLPTFDSTFFADLMTVGLLAIVVGGVAWLLGGAIRKWTANYSGASVLSALILAGAVASIAPRTASAQNPAHAAAKATRSTMAGVFTAEQATQGREVFIGTCTGCHTPAAHTGVVFTSKWVGRSVDDLFTYIRNTMPKVAPGSLSEDEYVWVTAYLLKLNGMPAGKAELSADPALMRGVRIDTAAALSRKP